MTNRLAIILGGFILCALILDLLLFGSEHMVFLGKRMFLLIEWVAFWR